MTDCSRLPLGCGTVRAFDTEGTEFTVLAPTTRSVRSVHAILATVRSLKALLHASDGLKGGIVSSPTEASALASVDPIYGTVGVLEAQVQLLLREMEDSVRAEEGAVLGNPENKGSAGGDGSLIPLEKATEAGDRMVGTDSIQPQISSDLNSQTAVEADESSRIQTNQDESSVEFHQTVYPTEVRTKAELQPSFERSNVNTLYPP